MSRLPVINIQRQLPRRDKLAITFASCEWWPSYATFDGNAGLDRLILCKTFVCLHISTKTTKWMNTSFGISEKSKNCISPLSLSLPRRFPHRTSSALRVDCRDVILRENSGLDFGSWSAGFAKHGPAIGGRLLLANDSVYGPIGSLGTALSRLTSTQTDFYGFVESAEIARHLQSWFLLFEPWVIRHAAFKAVLAQPFSTMTKRQIIANGEIGLFQRLAAAGFRYKALYEIDRAGLAARWFHASPMLFLWHELLCDVEVPFLKVQLLRDDPPGIEDVTTILQVVRQRDPEFYDLVNSHLSQ